LTPRARVLPALACALALLVAACAPTAGRKAPGGAADAPARALILYVVHGNANYTYHDDEGRRHLADIEAVAQALEVARRSTRAEVFIFHQKRTRFLGIFPGPAGRMIHYRNGAPLEDTAYGGSGQGDFAAEAALFHRLSRAPWLPACGPDSTGPQALFVYFGHEIAAAEAARGLARFAAPCGAHRPFSLVVLSACHGGTPAMARALAPYSDYLLASPGELHLSYLDTRPLAEGLGEAPQAPRNLGDTLARASFARLKKKTVTAISLALYDTKKASAYLEEHRAAWETAAAAPLHAYNDCSELAGFGPGGSASGAEVLYRPSRFGVDRSKSFHSGWECP
jgi:hypothetical protein